jgi:hypothetical protein
MIVPRKAAAMLRAYNDLQSTMISFAGEFGFAFS